MNKFPKISIVTPSFNQAAYIEETILSILNQNYPNLEYVIIDGGSTDGSVEIIKRYERHLKYWVSEPDQGQADAINKGLKYCTGDIFNWINSDDYLEDNALFEIADAYNPLLDNNVAGNVRNFYEGTEVSEIFVNKDLNLNGIYSHNDGGRYHQPGFWFSLKKLKQFEPFSLKYPNGFDHFHYIGYILKYPNIKYTNKVLVNFRLHSNSKTVSQVPRFIIDQINYLKERIELIDDQVIANYFNNIRSHTIAQYKINRIVRLPISKAKRVIMLLKCFKNKDKTLTYRFIIGAIKTVLIQ